MTWSPQRVLPALLVSCLAFLGCASGNAPSNSPSTVPTSVNEAVPPVAEEAVATLNLAKGRPATCSSTETADFPASAAVDGNAGTRWASSYTDNQWITVDLGSAQSIGKVVIKWEAAYAKSYDVKFSNDASTWSIAASNANGNGGNSEHLVTGSARYVGIQCNTRATAWGFSIFEIEVYGTTADTNTDTNLALKKPINASSVENASYPASQANDGNANSRWSSAFADNQWITVDLGSVSTVNKVVLRWEAAYAKTYVLKFSTDGTNWTPKATVTNNTGGVNTLTVSGSTRYVGLECQTRAISAGFSLWEFEVWGTAGTGGGGGTTSGLKILGYLGNWIDASTVEYDKLTHVIYAFAYVDNGGGVSIQSPANFSTMVSRAKAAGCKPILAIGGGGGNQDAPFRAMAANAGARQQFVNNCLNLVQSYGLDGIDIDWEYPTASDAANFNAMMQSLGSALHAKGKTLSAAVTVNDWPHSFPTTELFGVVDNLNVMAYDGSDHGTWSQFTNAITYWKGRGLPASKLMIGVPFYSAQGNAYRTILSTYGDAAAQTDYYGGNSYNGIPTIKAKADYAKQNAGGIMIWELGQDVHSDLSLLRAIYSRR